MLYKAVCNLGWLTRQPPTCINARVQIRNYILAPVASVASRRVHSQLLPAHTATVAKFTMKKGGKEKSSSDKNNTKWTDPDDAILVHTLAQEKANQNWGDNNPKKLVWTTCELALRGSEKVSGGRPKDVVAIKNRWQKLKQEYDTVKELRKLSGFGWDPAKKCVTASLDVWTDYCKKHPKAGPFRKKGFPFFDEIGDLIDGTRATGEFAFRGGQSAGPSHTRHSSASPTPPPNNDSFAIDPVLLDVSRDLNSSRDRDNSRDDEGVSEDEIPAEINPQGPSKTVMKRPLFDLDLADESGEVPDEEDDKEKATAQAENRKRAKSARASTGSERRNVRRVSAGEGMNSIAGSVTTAANTLADAMTAAASSIRPPAAELATSALTTNIGPNGSLSFAIALMEANEGFSESDVAIAAECMIADPNIATSYMSITSRTARSKLIRS
ncbi:hypothetical protein EDB84DRAFT_1568586 [Lactarius hengduanensis]|nr:hypothetical protein EDB84DRAFT_1568586 [Lactarius hengduanensis]